MKEYIKCVLQTGVPFGIILGLPMGLVTLDFSIGLIYFLMLGIPFGLLLGTFVFLQTRKFKKISLEITGGKEIVFEGGANHKMGKERVGGWLCLTKDELIFQSHKYNIQKHKTIIPLNEITEIKKSLTYIVPNGLKIFNNGNIDKFVVNTRRKWIKQINEVILSKKKEQNI